MGEGPPFNAIIFIVQLFVFFVHGGSVVSGRRGGEGGGSEEVCGVGGYFEEGFFFCFFFFLFFFCFFFCFFFLFFLVDLVIN